MPEQIRKAIEDIARPIGEVGTRAAQNTKNIGAGAERATRRVGRSLDKKGKQLANDPIRAAAAMATAGGSEVAISAAEETARKYAPNPNTPDPVEPPVIEPPTRMSTSGDKEAAKKRSIAEQRRRRGRASTILTDDPLGG